MKSKLIAAVAAASFAAAMMLAPATIDAARADSYNWTISSEFLSGSGTLTTGAASGGGFLVTDIDGSFAGSTIAALLAPGTLGGNNNIVYPDPSLSPSIGHFLDPNGLAFAFTAVGWSGRFFSDANGDAFALNFVNPLGGGGSEDGSAEFNLTSIAAVPGPIAGAGLPGLILAGAGLLGWWRRRQKFV